MEFRRVLFRSEEIAVTASASAGINALATALDFSGGRDRVLVSNYEFPTSGQIWHAQERRGAVVEHVPENESGLIPPEHFADRIDERTRIVVLSPVCYRHGGKFSDESIRSIVAMAHVQGAYVILRSEARRVGQVFVRTCRSRWSPSHSK